jgi:hypothetical protein
MSRSSSARWPSACLWTTTSWMEFRSVPTTPPLSPGAGAAAGAGMLLCSRPAPPSPFAVSPSRGKLLGLEAAAVPGGGGSWPWCQLLSNSLRPGCDVGAERAWVVALCRKNYPPQASSSPARCGFECRRDWWREAIQGTRSMVAAAVAELEGRRSLEGVAVEETAPEKVHRSHRVASGQVDQDRGAACRCPIETARRFS